MEKKEMENNIRDRLHVELDKWTDDELKNDGPIISIEEEGLKYGLVSYEYDTIDAMISAIDSLSVESAYPFGLWLDGSQ